MPTPTPSPSITCTPEWFLGTWSYNNSSGAAQSASYWYSSSESPSDFCMQYTVGCTEYNLSDSISFGDISDPNSEVSKLKNNPRDYSVLGYLNTRPRTTFLAKVRNPNPLMPDFESSPHSSREYHDKAHPVHHDDGDHNSHDEGSH